PYSSRCLMTGWSSSLALLRTLTSRVEEAVQASTRIFKLWKGLQSLCENSENFNSTVEVPRFSGVPEKPSFGFLGWLCGGARPSGLAKERRLSKAMGLQPLRLSFSS